MGVGQREGGHLPVGLLMGAEAVCWAQGQRGPRVQRATRQKCWRLLEPLLGWGRLAMAR